MLALPFCIWLAKYKTVSKTVPQPTQKGHPIPPHEVSANRYTYDSLDRLIREDNSVTNKTYLYTYDNNGNIRDEVIFVYTLGDAYDSTFIESNLWTYANSQWGDQLTNYNGGNIYYDGIGNPTRYYNGLEFAWDNVNNLASISDGWWINSYTYNDSGIRTSKTVYGVTHTYNLEGRKILSEAYGNVLLLYIYDEADSIIGIAYRTNSYASGVFDYYLFTKNLQGDIIGIYDTNGNCVASYKYNAWGECTVTNHTSANIGNLNPFRYRGYYFDQETGFYYLNSRYYDTELKRFINADGLGYLGANNDMQAFNLYAYCSNNPTKYIDPTGHSLWDFCKNFFSNIWKSVEAEFGVGGTHTQYTDGNHEDVHYHGYTETIFEDAQAIIDCDQCSHSLNAGFGDFGFNGGDFVVSTGMSAHFILGGHVSVGFNFSEWGRRMWEDLIK